ncbi:MAG: 16S rRNA (adenine(1518)-N(6)/adenine(1519)-N(6))-dimethyltransferase RsmA, partial [Rickettsia endosymbiont of Ixodes persulcatus]|nr:16S rRNA (adenine(1518)-N(6)/adenine(1519)-N(6))-dimethyltransferase RsmA [Rickettsia endosymbiont of Ixodes persulcatus]
KNTPLKKHTAAKKNTRSFNCPPSIEGRTIKKQYGQHFLRTQSVVDHMIEKVTITPSSSVMEIGCGDGFLSRSILQTAVARLWIFEIDHDWATYVQEHYPDKRLRVIEDNILSTDLEPLRQHTPWILLANLPYQITFPILHRIKEYRDLFSEGVVMVQEEVAQKIVAKSGRGYGFIGLYFQYYFDWQLMERIKPGAFLPPPKVDSRLLYFKPRKTEPIPNAEEFWKFIKMCFRQPRRTLRNNMAQSHYDASKIPSEMLELRAQQLSFVQLMQIWSLVNPA